MKTRHWLFGFFSVITCCLCNDTFAQPKTSAAFRHTISGIVGYGSSQYFPGPSSTLAYSFNQKNNRLMLSAGILSELWIFDGEKRSVKEYAFSYQRVLPLKKIHFSLGIGIAYNVHRLYINDLYVAQDNEIIKIKEWGFPLFATITYPAVKKISAGIQFHRNINDINPWTDGRIVLNFSF